MKKTKIDPKLYIIPIALVYAVIYLYRMFTNNPWYDELYTYYSFISKGPLYAAIHWPLPNNHIGYSAISGFLSYLGNPTIALRGVSFICAVANIFLLHKLVLRLTNIRLAYFAVFIYAGVFQVHNMAVQGRGYTLSTTCYLLALLMLSKICTEIPRLIDYMVFSLCLMLGIYAVPSSTFWVIPVCICGGIFLLVNKDYNKLIKLIISSVVGAILTIILYGTVWLAIGSNLLSKDPLGKYFGIYQIGIIEHHPEECIKAGLDYMLASPYIQSMDRGIVIKGLWGYLDILFEQFYSGLGVAITVFFIVVFVICLIRFIRNRKSFAECFLMVSIAALPIMLVIQSVQPYLRVFSFFGVVLSIAAVIMLQLIMIGIPNKAKVIESVLSILAGIALIGLLFTYKYMAPMADRENDILDALNLMQDNGTLVSDIGSIYYTDDYQKYVIKYFFDADPGELPMGDADYVMVSDTLNDSSITSSTWPMLTSYSDFAFDILEQRYSEVVSTRKYTIYRKTADQ